MTLIILKFGGTSLANTKLMKNAATKVANYVELGYQVVVVVSAMAGITDSLISLTSEISECKNQDALAEYASIITTGEQVSAGLFTLLIQEMGLKARSWLSWQTGIITDSNFADSNIEKINCEKILDSFKSGYQVAVVAGFQAITPENRVSTLGRGGSDTSAIILAGSLNAKRCNIYTDVEGVFTADPRIIAKAQKIPYINYEAMIAFAHAGAKVLQEKSVRWAQHYNVKVQVLSSFSTNDGTIIGNKPINEPVLGIALGSQLTHLGNYTNFNIAKISIIGTNIDSNKKLIYNLEQALAKENIEIIFKDTSFMTLSLIVAEEDKFNAIKILHKACGLDETIIKNSN